jgi:hypothetical protein
MTALQDRAFEIAKLSLTRDSRFYDDDLADLRRYYQKRTDDQCRESIVRMNSLANVTDEDIDRHCQLSGLFGQA